MMIAQNTPRRWGRLCISFAITTLFPLIHERHFLDVSVLQDSRCPDSFEILSYQLLVSIYINSLQNEWLLMTLPSKKEKHNLPHQHVQNSTHLCKYRRKCSKHQFSYILMAPLILQEHQNHRYLAGKTWIAHNLQYHFFLQESQWILHSPNGMNFFTKHAVCKYKVQGPISLTLLPIDGWDEVHTLSSSAAYCEFHHTIQLYCIIFV